MLLMRAFLYPDQVQVVRARQVTPDLYRDSAARGYAAIIDGCKPLKMKKWLESHFIHFVLSELMDEF